MIMLVTVLYFLADVMVTDGGRYTCLAISQSGAVSKTAYLNVIGEYSVSVATRNSSELRQKQKVG